MFKKIKTKNHFIPVVFDKYDYDRCTDIYSRLLKDRIIFISGTIDEEMADTIVAQILFLESQDEDEDIYIYIDSPGGMITAGLAIYDTMQLVAPDICTICVGQASSMGAFLLAAGARYKRFALPNARILIHQPTGGFEGQVSDIQIHTEEISKIKIRLNRLLAYHTDQTEEQIAIDTERDTYLDAYDAIDYGIIDDILRSRKKNIDY